MIILAITDIHGAYHVAESIMLKEQADVVILGGDLTNVGQVKEVEKAINRFRQHCKRILCIAGNMDLPTHDDWYLAEGMSINAHGMIVDDVGFFGVSGGPLSPLHTIYEIPESEIRLRADKGYAMVQQCRKKIFVPHPPPYGTKVDIIHAGYHVGSTAVREFIEDAKPDAVICGHIHEARGQDEIETTKIVNCGYGHHGYYAILTIDDEIKISNRQIPL